jgi:hypothetical protein
MSQLHCSGKTSEVDGLDSAVSGKTSEVDGFSSAVDLRGLSVTLSGMPFSPVTRRLVAPIAVAALGLVAIMGAARPVAFTYAPQSAGRTIALVGGTLIDGFGGVPLRNSVVLVSGERITAVGQVDTLPVPAGAEVISTKGCRCSPVCGTCTCI